MYIKQSLKYMYIYFHFYRENIVRTNGRMRRQLAIEKTNELQKTIDGWDLKDLGQYCNELIRGIIKIIFLYYCYIIVNLLMLLRGFCVAFLVTKSELKNIN